MSKLSITVIRGIAKDYIFITLKQVFVSFGEETKSFFSFFEPFCWKGCVSSLENLIKSKKAP